jgi:hypothetical protein
MDEKDYKNLSSGLIIEKPQKQDFIFGADSPVKETLTTKGDWSDYLPTREKQHSLYFDSMACVSFSAINVIEIIFTYLIKNKLLTLENMEWLNKYCYFDTQGFVNFNDRYIAKLSGTTRQGNSGQRVADAIRHYGLVPQFRWDYPITQRTPVFDWDDFYQDVPEDIIQLGLEFLKRFEINYEQVYYTNLDEAILHSPLQVFISTRGELIDGILQKTNNKVNHAVVKFTKEPVDSYYPILDTYELSNNYIRKVALDFKYHATGFIYNITQKNMSDTKILKDKNSNQVGVFFPAHNSDAMKSYLKNIGRDVPTKEDKSLDWDRVVIDGKFELTK